MEDKEKILSIIKELHSGKSFYTQHSNYHAGTFTNIEITQNDSQKEFIVKEIEKSAFSEEIITTERILVNESDLMAYLKSILNN